MSRISTSSAGGGSTNIQDSNGNPITATGGALNVNVTSGTPGTPVSLYNEISAIAMGASSPVLTYTVPMGQSLTIASVMVSSDSVSTIEFQLNTVTNAKGRIYYTRYNLDFDYSGYVVPAGTVITILATNNSLQGVAMFNATLRGSIA